MSSQNTEAKILIATQQLLMSGGIGSVSFDTIARELGISKQAVLYWFPSKGKLLSAMFVDWLGAEAEAAINGLAHAKKPNEAIDAFVRAIAHFHMSNLDRFRMMYLAPQTLRSGVQEARNAQVLDRIHRTTSEMYSALAAHLDAPPEQARRAAFSIHSATLGLLLMVGLADSIGDPLKHSEGDLVNALIARLSDKAQDRQAEPDDPTDMTSH